MTASRLDEGIGSVLEIVIDGLTAEDVAAAMRAGIAALCEIGAAGGLRRISAGNYGGKLGPFQFHLRELAG
jgi:formylmethanofuran--tetrahydromethanopterin N-formyltransferase